MSKKRKADLATLEAIYPDLPDEALSTLCEFAGFLADKYPPAAMTAIEKEAIPRPQEESVIAAIRRLAKTYSMLDKKIVFDQTSAAMSAHVLQEVSSKESIDRLEQVFAEAYQAYVKTFAR